MHWTGLGRNLTWFIVSWAALLLQVALVVPVYAVGSAADGVIGPLLALLWGGLTFFAGWSWLRGRWRIVVAPIATVAAILVAGAVS